jgi:hypothetical protein
LQNFSDRQVGELLNQQHHVCWWKNAFRPLNIEEIMEIPLELRITLEFPKLFRLIALIGKFSNLFLFRASQNSSNWICSKENSKRTSVLWPDLLLSSVRLHSRTIPNKIKNILNFLYPLNLDWSIKIVANFSEEIPHPSLSIKFDSFTKMKKTFQLKIN